jgi:hypothetical protein
MTVRSRRQFAWTAAAALVVGLAACERRSPTSPILPRPSQPVGGTPSVTVIRIELEAPAEIAPGESVQLALKAFKSDGSVEDISGQATWTSSARQVLGLASTGLASGLIAGESVVTASYAARGAVQRIFVLPKGTFRLGGVVTEDGLPIESVAVTVTSGVGEGLTASTGVDGSYTFYGVAGTARLLAKKEGYLNAVQQVDVTQHRTYDFAMTLERPRMSYSGIYSLTISTASPCQSSFGSFPDAARRRVYTAHATQEGRRVTVALTDADFIQTAGHGAGFAGIFEGSESIKFSLGNASYYYYYSHGYFDVVERFGMGAFVVANGMASVRGTSERLSGTFAGLLAFTARVTTPFWPFQSGCYSPTHGFEMVRR